MPGPPKTPTIKLQRRGSWRAKERKNEPMPDKFDKLPTAPEHFNKETKQFYKKVGRKLLNIGVLTEVDYESFVLMCEEYQQYKEAERMCHPLLIKTSNGNIIQNPAVGIKNRSSDALKKSMTYFGMNPSSRANINVTSNDMNDKNKKHNYFKVG